MKTNSSILSKRQLNRMTLARQMLLHREETPALSAIERLVGLQAQQAKPPFVGLWSRVANFRTEDLKDLLLTYQVVRATLMRATLHLMSSQDYRSFRAPLQPVLSQAMQSTLRTRINHLDIPGLLDDARTYFQAKPRTFAEFREFLLQRDPNCDERALGYVVRTHLPLIQVPIANLDWCYSATASFTLSEACLKAPFLEDAKPHALVLRYLAAFGPASVADVQAWSGLKGLSQVIDELRPQFLVFRDERGRELFDLPNAPHPSEEVEAPVKFLPEFDNLVLGHDDRSRLITDEHRKRIVTKNLLVLATFLVDGFVAGSWRVARKKKVATLMIEPFLALSKSSMAEIATEGDQLLHFLEPDAEVFEVQVQPSAKSP